MVRVIIAFVFAARHFATGATHFVTAAMRVGIAVALIGLAATVIGCNSLPAGDVSTISATSPIRSRGHVILLRGWRGVYSTGIDQLATELRAEGFKTAVYRESQWRDVANALKGQRGHSLSEYDDGPLVLIGFSYGADHAISIARHLPSTQAIKLLVTIDPVTPADVPPNVIECYNFYRSNGWIDVFPFFRGVPLKSEPRVRLTNVDLLNHPELDDPGMGHRHIAGSAKVHRAIIDRVLQSCPPRPATRPTTALSATY